MVSIASPWAGRRAKPADYLCCSCARDRSALSGPTAAARNSSWGQVTCPPACLQTDPMRSMKAIILITALLVGLTPALAPASATSLAKCAPGKIRAHHRYHTQHGTFLVEITKKNANLYYGCVLTPSLHVHR